jgi:hypothetical protein
MTKIKIEAWIKGEHAIIGFFSENNIIFDVTGIVFDEFTGIHQTIYELETHFVVMYRQSHFEENGWVKIDDPKDRRLRGFCDLPYLIGEHDNVEFIEFCNAVISYSKFNRKKPWVDEPFYGYRKNGYSHFQPNYFD